MRAKFNAKYFGLLAGAALLAACGGGDSAEQREAKMEKEARKHGVDADVTVDKKGDVKKVEIKRGNSTVGQNLDLPEDFPEDVKVADGWSIMSVAPAPSGGFMIQALTDAGADETVIAARAALTAKGWEEVAFNQPAPTMSQISFEKDDRMTNVNVIDSGGPQLAVQMLTMKKPQ